MTTGQVSTGNFHHAFVTVLPTDKCALSLQTREALVCMPLYIYDESSPQMTLLDTANNQKVKVNITPSFIEELIQKLKLEYVENGSGDLNNTFGPEDIFYYLYAILNSNTYRRRYSEFLKIDFPRFPLINDKKLFGTLVDLGKSLVNLHLLGKNPFDKTETIFGDNSKWKITPKTDNSIELNSDWTVKDIKYDEKEKRIYINRNQYFDGIEKEVWDFIIGGYKVLEKWLMYRKKAFRVLSTEDIKHFIKICVSLRESVRVMKEIDQAIPTWPIK